VFSWGLRLVSSALPIGTNSVNGLNALHGRKRRSTDRHRAKKWRLRFHWLLSRMWEALCERRVPGPVSLVGLSLAEFNMRGPSLRHESAVSSVVGRAGGWSRHGRLTKTARINEDTRPLVTNGTPFCQRRPFVNHDPFLTSDPMMERKRLPTPFSSIRPLFHRSAVGTVNVSIIYATLNNTFDPF